MISLGENANANFEVNIIPDHASGRAAAADELFTSKGKVKGYVLLADCFNCLMKQK